MADTEKITINMSVVDLGQIDLLVEQGFYSSRTYFIRTAIRNQLNGHADTIKQTLIRKAMVLGVYVIDREALEKRQAAGEQLEIKVVGMAAINADVTPELARATIRSLKIHGVLRAPQAVKDALADRMK